MKKETNALQVIAGAARCPEYSPPMVLTLMKKLKPMKSSLRRQSSGNSRL